MPVLHLSSHPNNAGLLCNSSKETETLLGIKYVVLVGCHVLFNLTKNLVLEVGMAPTYDPNMFVLSILQNPLFRDGLPPQPQLCDRERRGQKNSRKVKTRVLENSWKANVYNKNYCCFSHATKMPEVGTGNWKYHHWKLIHGETAQLGSPLTASTSPVRSAECP